MEQEVIFGESSNSSNLSFNRTTCKYFLKNSCRYGDRCRNLHTDNNVINNSNHGTNIQDSDLAVPTIDPDIWIQAPEFVPKSSQLQGKSFAEIVGHNLPPNHSVVTTTSVTGASSSGSDFCSELCPYLLGGGVCYNDPCDYLHGDFCELCQRFCLHPHNTEQQRKHHMECIAQHEKDMELSFAIQKSKDKTCGVCFEIIMEKPGREQRFGILPNCVHCFCLECIRKWRQAEQFDNKIKRACPECRITSDFVCPSTYWVDTKEEKDKLIDDYKNALQEKDCKYFNKGRGKCPFGNRCFYRHVNSDGVKVDVGLPPRPVRRRNHLGELEVLNDIQFWDLIIERNLLIDDVISFLSDSSTMSDY